MLCGCSACIINYVIAFFAFIHYLHSHSTCTYIRLIGSCSHRKYTVNPIEDVQTIPTLSKLAVCVSQCKVFGVIWLWFLCTGIDLRLSEGTL